MQESSNDIIIFLSVVSFLITVLISFIVTILLLYKKKHLRFQKNIEEIKATHEKNILSSKLEIQEETFQNISREIHDNITLSLTLAKLHLHTLDWTDKDKTMAKLNLSIELLGKSIRDLSDISKGLDASLIIRHGLINALEEELQRINQIGIFRVSLTLTGNPVYLDVQKELIIFRMIQEAFNNIIKHSNASHASLDLHFASKKLYISVVDNGIGFDPNLICRNRKAGLKNLATRIKSLYGTIKISSLPNLGTSLSFTIPFE